MKNTGNDDSDIDEELLFAEFGITGAKPRKEEKSNSNSSLSVKKPKKRAPRQNAILLENNLNIGSTFDSIKIDNNKSLPTLPIIGNSSSAHELESKLMAYLSIQLRSIYHEFVALIGDCFSGDSLYQTVVVPYINDLCSSVREAIMIKNQYIASQATPAFVEPLFNRFYDVFHEAQQFIESNSRKTFNYSQLQIPTANMTVKKLYSGYTQVLNRELNELDIIKSTRPIAEPLLKDKCNELNIKKGELESIIRILKKESLIIEKNLTKLTSEFKAYSEIQEDLPNDEDFEESIMNDIYSIKEKLTNRSYRINASQLSELSSLLDEINSMRSMTNYYSNQIPQSNNIDESSQNESSNISDNQIDIDILKSVRKRLESAQDQRNVELSNATTFLSTMKKREKGNKTRY